MTREAEVIEHDLEGRSFFVTGANSGIGRATIEALAARGGRVILAARSEERAQPVLAGIRRRHGDAAAQFVQIDLADLASVRQAAESFLATGRRLDVLINNAGLAGRRGLTKDGFELTVGTNHLGPFLLTQLLLPTLREAPHGRIVNVSSEAHKAVRQIDWDSLRRPAQKPFPMYSLSKFMNVIHAHELARRLSDTRITTASLHPGVIASQIWRELPWPIEPLIKLFMASNEEGAKTPLFCATAPELTTVSGRYYIKCREVAPNPLADDAALAERLFAWSSEGIESALGLPSN